MIRVRTNLKEETTRENGGREASSCGCAALPQGPDPAANGEDGRALPLILSEKHSVAVRLGAGERKLPL